MGFHGNTQGILKKMRSEQFTSLTLTDSYQKLTKISHCNGWVVWTNQFMGISWEIEPRMRSGWTNPFFGAIKSAIFSWYIAWDISKYNGHVTNNAGLSSSNDMRMVQNLWFHILTQDVAIPYFLWPLKQSLVECMKNLFIPLAVPTLGVFFDMIGGTELPVHLHRAFCCRTLCSRL
jgi:hypothetical protein